MLRDNSMRRLKDGLQERTVFSLQVELSVLVATLALGRDHSKVG